jgi:hypothetical protein
MNGKLVYKMMLKVSVRGKLFNCWFYTAKIRKSKAIIQIIHGNYHKKNVLGFKS